jgi:hypothetical protein
VRRTGRLVFLLALAVYLATTGGSMATDIMSYEVTKGIVERGTVAMSYNVFGMEAHRGTDGRYYAPYGIGHAIYSVPFYAAARAVERATGLAFGKPEVLTKAGFVLGSAYAAALTVWIGFFFAWRLSGSDRSAALAALAIGFATFLWPYAKFGFNAPLAALCVTAGTYGVWLGVRADRPLVLVVGGAALGGALLVRYELALVCLPLAVWMAFESRGRGRRLVQWALLAGLPVTAALLVTLYYNQVRFGNPFDTGYLRDQTLGVGSFWSGLTGLLFSPGRSVVLYSPVVAAGLEELIAPNRRDRGTRLLLLGQFVVVLCFYASLTNWDGERSYGPRYLLPVVPLLVLPLASAAGGTRSRLLLTFVMVSVIVQLPGVLVDFSKVGAARVIGPRTETERQWSWQASGLVINTRASIAAIPDNIGRLMSGSRPQVKPGDTRTRDFSDQLAFSLDFWWLYAFYLGAFSAAVAVGCGAACWGAVALLAWTLRAQLRAGAMRASDEE